MSISGIEIQITPNQNGDHEYGKFPKIVEQLCITNKLQWSTIDFLFILTLELVCESTLLVAKILQIAKIVVTVLVIVKDVQIAYLEWLRVVPTP